MARTVKLSRRGLLIALLIILVAAWLVANLVTLWHREKEDYTLIEDGLYMGAYVRRPPPGVRAVVNLCETPDGYECESHLWEPIRDSAPAPDLDWLRRVVQFVDDHRREGDVVFVHCLAGVSRSGMVVTAYEMRKNRWTRDEAIEFVRSRRPQTWPNPAFMELLLEWEREALGATPAGH
jgi:hypothetical protein